MYIILEHFFLTLKAQQQLRQRDLEAARRSARTTYQWPLFGLTLWFVVCGILIAAIPGIIAGALTGSPPSY